MSIRIGIYDFFAHTLPGGLYLLALLYSFNLVDPVFIQIVPKDLSIIDFLLLGAASYILGLLCTPIAFKFWKVLNRSPNVQAEALQRVKKRFPHFELRCNGREWPILHARIEILNEELGARVDKHRATGIMLRNAIMAFVALSLVSFSTAAVRGPRSLEVLVGIGFLVAAYLSNHECRKYLRWSYSLIFEATIADGLKSSEILRLNQWSADDDPASP